MAKFLGKKILRQLTGNIALGQPPSRHHCPAHKGFRLVSISVTRVDVAIEDPKALGIPINSMYLLRQILEPSLVA
jgi:hypothetical protein